MADDLMLGAHMSIAGGIDKAIARGLGVGCTALQIFTKSRSSMKISPDLPPRSKRRRSAARRSSSTIPT